MRTDSLVGRGGARVGRFLCTRSLGRSLRHNPITYPLWLPKRAFPVQLTLLLVELGVLAAICADFLPVFE